MTLSSTVRSLSAAAVLAAILTLPAPAGASQADLAQAPLGTAPTVTVLPNLMFILDDSGSMGWNFMPDNVNDSNTCKTYVYTSGGSTSTSCQLSSGTNLVSPTTDSTRHSPSNQWLVGPPAFAAQFNTMYYNPQITYSPGVNSSGASLGSQTDWDEVKINPYTSGSTFDLQTQYPEAVFCLNASDSATSTNCRRNGFANDGTTLLASFRYSNAVADATGGYGWPISTSSGAFRFIRMRFGAPYYYTISPREYCTDVDLVNCVLATSPAAPNIVPAPVRYCKTSALANQDAFVTGTSGSPATPNCQAKFDSAHTYARYGTFTRTNIVPSVTTYGNRPNRTDCAAAPNCTYSEEMTNFANWYAYYHTRMQTMKTVSGLVFSNLDDRYRVGFVTINASSSARYLKIDKFTPTQKSDWFNKFYSITPSGGTPLREALSRVGRHYAAVTTGINAFMPEDPIQYSCQQNFALLTTDGYWNGNPGLRIDGTAVLNQDNVDSGYSTRAAGAYDGNLSGTASASSTGSSDTLADVAMYYYKTDLRASGPVAKNNVPTSAKDTNAQQHMVTFTLGLGLDGLMTYRSDYETATAGDFYKIKTSATGCSWASGTCNWPQARGNDPRALDDLWHAAVNGRGQYFSAKDPNSLQTGLTNTLSSIQAVTGAAASSATSTPNITPTDNFIYSSTYRTVKWDGEVVAERIDPVTGALIPGIVWSASAQLNGRVAASSDTRTIYTFDAASPPTPTKLKPFLYTSLTAAEKAFFDNKCIPAVLPQCGSMSGGDLTQANKGSNLVPWLRGQTKDEGTLYRDRENVLGDTVNAKPAFVGKPNLLYGDAVTPDYTSFKVGPAGSRQNMLYIAANDGMLHALNADTGAELWAYVPRIVMPELYKLAANNWDIKHRYYVDGSPATMDVFIGGAWKTILVAGLNAGGRGYYALDVTDPLNPKGLWEFCADATLCPDNKDDNIGYTFGQPIITKRPTDGKWVVIVSSGYNNVSPGDGKGYLFVLDASTGAILDKVDTGVGDTTTPSGLAKISGFATNFMVDNTTTFVYGGDLLGNVFRFDMSTSGPTRQRIGQLFDGSSPAKPQSVTTRPEITRFDAGYNVVYVGSGRLLGSTDLQDPATLSPPENRAYQQTVWGFKDTGTDLGNLRSPAAKLVQQTLSVVDATTRTVSTNPVDWTTQNGWYVDLNPVNDSPGERVNIDMQLVKGVLLVATNEPNSDACSSGGDSFLYQFDYQSGSYLASANTIVGTKFGSALIAGFVVYRLPSGQLKYTGIDVSGKKQVGGVMPGGGGAIGKRVSWRELIL